MTLIPTEHRPPNTADTLESLFAEAEGFGFVHIFSSRDSVGLDRYSASIRFPTVAGTELRADSNFRLPLKRALRDAIDKARLIREQFK